MTCLAKILMLVASTAHTRAELAQWVERHRPIIAGLADGEAVIAHARQRYSDLPKEEVLEAAE